MGLEGSLRNPEDENRLRQSEHIGTKFRLAT